VVTTPLTQPATSGRHRWAVCPGAACRGAQSGPSESLADRLLDDLHTVLTDLHTVLSDLYDTTSAG
jgi:hypothetical protein